MFCLDNVTKVAVDSSSRGNQSKFYVNGCWIKLDSPCCYEGLAEDFVSKFCDAIYDFPSVRYASSRFEYIGDEHIGCFCANMHGRQDMSFVSFRDLFRQWNISTNLFFKEDSVEQNIRNVVSLVKERLNLDLLDYFRRTLLLDSLIINEDRHLRNIGICYCRSDGRFYEAPCFDNGSSLFCVNWTYRKNKSFKENISAARSVARPFSKFFDKQVQAILNLGCRPLTINGASVEALLRSYSNKFYSVEMNELVKSVLRNRLAYYRGIAFNFV